MANHDFLEAELAEVEAVMRQAERELAEKAERAYERTVRDWQQTLKKTVRVRHRGAHLQVTKWDKQRGRAQPQTLRFSSSSPAPRRTLPKEAAADKRA